MSSSRSNATSNSTRSDAGRSKRPRDQVDTLEAQFPPGSMWVFVDEKRTFACGIRIDRYIPKLGQNGKICICTIMKALDTCPLDVDERTSIDCTDASDLRNKFVEPWSDEPTSDSTSNLQHCTYMSGKTKKHCRVRKDWTRVIHNFAIYSSLSVSVTLSVSIDGKDTPRKITFVARTNVEQIKPKTSTHTPLLSGKVVKTLGTSPRDCLTKHRRALLMLSAIVYRKPFTPWEDVGESEALSTVIQLLSLPSRDKRVSIVKRWYDRNANIFKVSPSSWKHVVAKEQTSVNLFDFVSNTRHASSSSSRLTGVAALEHALKNEKKKYVATRSPFKCPQSLKSLSPLARKFLCGDDDHPDDGTLEISEQQSKYEQEILREMYVFEQSVDLNRSKHNALKQMIRYNLHHSIISSTHTILSHTTDFRHEYTSKTWTRSRNFLSNVWSVLGRRGEDGDLATVFEISRLVNGLSAEVGNVDSSIFPKSVDITTPEQMKTFLNSASMDSFEIFRKLPWKLKVFLLVQFNSQQRGILHDFLYDKNVPTSSLKTVEKRLMHGIHQLCQWRHLRSGNYAGYTNGTRLRALQILLRSREARRTITSLCDAGESPSYGFTVDFLKQISRVYLEGGMASVCEPNLDIVSLYGIDNVNFIFSKSCK